MGRSQETFSKKEREKKRQKRKKEKAERREQRKAEGKGKKSFEDMLMYVDEDGNLTKTPPDPSKKRKIDTEEILISVPKKEKDELEGSVRTGIVKFFNEEKGYGFIIESETKESVFVHMAGLIDPIRSDNKVSFEIESGPKGLVATKVTLVK